MLGSHVQRQMKSRNNCDTYFFGLSEGLPAKPTTKQSSRSYKLFCNQVKETLSSELSPSQMQCQAIPMFGTQPPEKTLRINQKLLQRQRNEPISLSLTSGRIENFISVRGQQKETTEEVDDDNIVFSIQTLRKPLVEINKNDRLKLSRLQKLHSAIDDDFLDRRIEAQNIVFVPYRTTQAEATPSWEPSNLNNVVININKYRAKYDFDIAQKLKMIARYRNKDAENLFKRQAIYEILQICSYEFTKNQTIYNSIWSTQGQQIKDLDLVPEGCKMLIVSELPMHNSGFLTRSKEHGLAISQDYQTHDKKLFFDRGKAVQQLEDKIGNEFRVRHQYYKGSQQKVADDTKRQWVQNNIDSWIDLSKRRIETKNILQEFQVQQHGPLYSARLQIDFSKSLRDRGALGQSQASIIQEKMLSHRQNQREIMSNTTFFKYQNNNKSLPKTLRSLEETEKLLTLSKHNTAKNRNGTIMISTQKTQTPERVSQQKQARRQKVTDGPNVMTADQVEKLSTKFGLIWKDIYELHSEYNSYVGISIEEQKFKIEAKQKKIFEVTANESKAIKIEILKLQQLLRTAKANRQVCLGNFVRFSDVGRARFKDITYRIISSFGIDISNEYSIIEFENFCRINSFLKYQKTSPSDLIKIWVKILNPLSIPVITVLDMTDFFERFARGSIQEQPTLISNTFAKHMIDLFKLESCMVDDDRIDMIKLQTKIEDGTFSTDLFNQLIQKDCMYFVRSENFNID